MRRREIKHTRPKAPPLSKIVELHIENLSTDGSGVARSDRVIFVQRALPQEKIIAEIYEEKTSFGKATLKEVLAPSPYRQTPPCPFYDLCGGCQLQHLQQVEHSQVKENFLRETLSRIGRWERDSVAKIKVDVIEGEKLNYRQRISLHGENGVVGFYDLRGKELVDIGNCIISHPTIQKYWDEFTSVIRKNSLKEKVTVEVTAVEDGLLSFDTPSKVLSKVLSELPFSSSRKEFFVSHPFLEKFSQSKNGFLQPHKDAATAYVKAFSLELKKLSLGSSFSFVDLYCGAGVFTGVPQFVFPDKKVVCLGVEGDKSSIESATKNHSTRNDVKFLVQDVKKFTSQMKPVDVIFLDPPRTGATISVMEDICAKGRPKAVFYLACDAASFARDGKVLLDNGYELFGSLKLFDMFPQTRHYEVLGLFVKN